MLILNQANSLILEPHRSTKHVLHLSYFLKKKTEMIKRFIFGQQQFLYRSFPTRSARDERGWQTDRPVLLEKNQFISADAWNEVKVLFPACVFVFSSSCSTFLDVLFFFHEFSQKAHKCHFFVTLVKGIKGDMGGGVITCADGIKAGYKDSLLGIGYCRV